MRRHHASSRPKVVSTIPTSGGTADEGGHANGPSGRGYRGDQPQADARRGGEGGREETARGQVTPSTITRYLARQIPSLYTQKLHDEFPSKSYVLLDEI